MDAPLTPAAAPLGEPTTVPRTAWQRLRSGAGRVWRGLQWIQRAVARMVKLLLLLLLVGGGVAAWRVSTPEPLLPQTVLLLELEGALREQASGDAKSNALAQLRGDDRQEVRLRDVLAALDAAGRDPQIDTVLLRLDEFSGAGLAGLREVAAAIERVKAAGKSVVAWGNGFDQRAYYLAAHASEVWLHPMGSVMVEGFGRRRTYYKDALDKLGIQANVLRVGKYKNAGEPYFANGPSPESLESEALLYDALWKTYTDGVERARKLKPGAVQASIESLPQSLAQEQGDVAKWALAQGWVDALKTQDEMRAALMERGQPDAEGKSFRHVRLKDYLRRLPAPAEGDGLAVVVAEGEISDGQAPSGRVGGDSTSALIRRARQDERVKALVLRVNSPGGSAFASEQIRRELQLTREAGKPVVVSMGDVAASGGYWIAMAADEVLADEGTITGSIGVFAMLPTGAGLMDKLGLRTGGHRTTWLAGGYDPRAELDPRFAELVQLSIGRIYADFTAMAAKARGRSVEELDAVAQGRVWTGPQALERKLIDRVGSWNDALAAARTRAQLPEQAPVRFIEKPVSRAVRLMQSLGLDAAVQAVVQDGVQEWSQGQAWASAWAGTAAVAGPEVVAEWVWLQDVVQGRKPFAAVVHCLCRPLP